MTYQQGCRGHRGRFVVRLLLLAGSLFLAGCATIFNESDQVVRLTNSKPEGQGAEVRVSTTDNIQIFYLPASLQLAPNWAGVRVEVVDPKYVYTTQRVKTSISPYFWLNVFTLGFGFIIDIMSGDFWVYQNELVIPTIRRPIFDPPSPE